MRQKIFQLLLTGLMGLATLVANAQITYVMDTIETGQFSALAHSYRERAVSNPGLQKELEAGINQFWMAYLTGLRRVMDENDDVRAAEILKKMKAELRPQYEELQVRLKTWKKSHTAAEFQGMKSLCADNLNKTEAVKTEADYNLQVRSEKNKSFHRAYLNLKKSMARTN